MHIGIYSLSIYHKNLEINGHILVDILFIYVTKL